MTDLEDLESMSDSDDVTSVSDDEEMIPQNMARQSQINVNTSKTVVTTLPMEESSPKQEEDNDYIRVPQQQSPKQEEDNDDIRVLQQQWEQDQSETLPVDESSPKQEEDNDYIRIRVPQQQLKQDQSELEKLHTSPIVKSEAREQDGCYSNRSVHCQEQNSEDLKVIPSEQTHEMESPCRNVSSTSQSVTIVNSKGDTRYQDGHNDDETDACVNGALGPCKVIAGNENTFEGNEADDKMKQNAYSKRKIQGMITEGLRTKPVPKQRKSNAQMKSPEQSDEHLIKVWEAIEANISELQKADPILPMDQSSQKQEGDNDDIQVLEQHLEQVQRELEKLHTSPIVQSENLSVQGQEQNSEDVKVIHYSREMECPCPCSSTTQTIVNSKGDTRYQDGHNDDKTDACVNGTSGPCKVIAGNENTYEGNGADDNMKQNAYSKRKIQGMITRGLRTKPARKRPKSNAQVNPSEQIDKHLIDDRAAIEAKILKLQKRDPTLLRPDKGVVFPNTMAICSYQDKAYYVEQFLRSELFRQRCLKKYQGSPTWRKALSPFQLWVLENEGTAEIEAVLHPLAKRKNNAKPRIDSWRGDTSPSPPKSA